MRVSRKLHSDKLVEFLKEDIGFGDITSELLIPEDQWAHGKLYFREAGVVSGLEETESIFQLLGCSVTAHTKDGDWVKENQILLEVDGSAISILSGERTALNLIGRMAGVATATAETVKKASMINPNVKVAATRKCMPGLRLLDKKAVMHGGGDSHRYRLDDCVLIKDNHLTLVESITNAVDIVRSKVSFTKKIEVEVRTIDQAVEAAEAGADIIMFDNMSPAQIRDTMKVITEKNLREGILFEASGGITPDNITDYASTMVDVISLGYLTHSIRSLNVKLEVEMI
jgi:nicotinate-nucleotide pyrophosphorylase (carboxylating)